MQRGAVALLMPGTTGRASGRCRGLRAPRACAARMAALAVRSAGALDVLRGRKLVSVLAFLPGGQPLLSSSPTC